MGCKGYQGQKSYLSNLQHLGIQAVQVEDELRKADQGQLDGEHFPEGPVVGGVRKGVQGPFLQHAPWHHVALYLLQNVAENLKRGDRKRGIPLWRISRRLLQL